LKTPRRREIISTERTATMRPLARLLVIVLYPLAAAPAWADAIYKWVDERGTVHYSNARPARQKAEVLAEDRVSTIQSEPAFAQTSGPSRAESEFLARRVDRLERELAIQRQASRDTGAAEARAMQAAYDRCLTERRIDCDGGYGSPYVIVTAPLIPVRRHLARSPRFHPIRSITGVTAGNVVTFGTPTSSRTGRRFR
jgi:hypothetical protein